MLVSSLPQFYLVGISALFFSLACPTVCFLPRTSHHGLQRRLPRSLMAKDDFINVEFETVATTATTTVVTEESLTLSPDKKSLLELSLDLDPQWKEARIPFVDKVSNRVIDCHLAFCVDLDGSTTYGIGVPCDTAVAITLEEHGTTTYMNPTADNEELVELFAEKLHEHFGDDIYLKHTPKILTITGNLDQYTANWKETLFDDTVDREILMDDTDEGLDFFYEFMKKELGEKEFQKTIDECKEENGLDKDLLELFTVPGLGQDKHNVEGIEEMLKTLCDQDQISPFTNIGQDLTHDGVALKLVGFHFNTNTDKSYTLVQLLKPFTIVGKYIPNEDNLEFELLTPDEERLVIPRLETICKKDLEEAGFSSVSSGPL